MADSDACIQKRAEATARFAARDSARDQLDRDALATELAHSFSQFLKIHLSQADRDALRAYITPGAPGRPSTEGAAAILARVIATAPEDAQSVCAESDASPDWESGPANLPSARSGFKSCRKVEKTETPGWARSVGGQIVRFLRHPTTTNGPGMFQFSWNFPIVNLYREPKSTYSYSFPTQDRSLEALDPFDTLQANLAASPGPERFRLRMCRGVSRDSAHAVRLCYVANLQQLLELKDRSEHGEALSADEVKASNPDAAMVFPGAERFVRMQSSELCKTALADSNAADRRVAVYEGTSTPGKSESPARMPGESQTYGEESGKAGI